MLTGKSVWHVNQDIGKSFAIDSLKGYYNNMTEKVSKLPELLESDRLPLLEVGKNQVEMPVTIFQYGLGAYDLFLQCGDEKYLKKFMQCVKWTLLHQDNKGRWNNFFHVCPDNPYGAMAQGEGASLLLRAFVYTGEEKYFVAAKKAIDYMLLSVTEGGTTLYDNEEVLFAEYTHLPVVMNGWIFSWWGLYDYVLVTSDKGHYKQILDASCDSLEKNLSKFKTFYWSKYDLGGKMASPFYHNLHIAQMEAMYQLTGRVVFREYAQRWKRQQRNILCKSIAFAEKAFQKLLE